MNRPSRRAALGALLALAAKGAAWAQPLEIAAAMPGARMGGSTRFTVWGFDVYDAALWIAPGFTPNAYERHAFALELSYLRDFSSEAISSRSIEEMRRLPGGVQAPLQSWYELLRKAFPDLRRGDRITGFHRPGEGAVFMANGQTTGVIDDVEFARLFFGIWLSPHTSEPRLRLALLARVGGP